MAPLSAAIPFAQDHTGTACGKKALPPHPLKPRERHPAFPHGVTCGLGTGHDGRHMDLVFQVSWPR